VEHWKKMQRPVFISVHAPSNGDPTSFNARLSATAIETPYMVSIHPGKAATDYVPTTKHEANCKTCFKEIPRNQFAFATKHWNGTGVRCKQCTITKAIAPSTARKSLFGWVHDSAPSRGFVAAQVGGIVEDDSGAAVSLN
jgi:hypothetical protein